MKASKYNFLFSVGDENYLGFNSFTTALFEVSKSEALKIKEILQNPNGYKKDKTFRLLSEAGFILADKDDEFKYLEESFQEGKESDEFFNITIAPTLNCNFKCDYCFEACPNSKMDDKVKDRIIQLVREKAPKIRQFSLSWFGGEPLLAMDTLKELSTKIMKICHQNKVKYESSISTNGYLLNFERAQELKGLSINSAQVTIDGPAEIHDKRRPSKDGRSSFKVIIKNLKEVVDLIDISIRINLDKRNISYIPELLEILAKEEIIPRANFYFGHVKAINGDNQIANYCLSNEEYAIAIKKLYKIITEKGYGEPIYPEIIEGGYCGACAKQTIVVDPEGKVFRCWADIGSSDVNTIGDICRENYISGLPEEQIRKCKKADSCYLSWNPFNNDDCKKCKVLPLCMGGCPMQGIQKNETKSCTHWRYNLKDILYLHYQMQHSIKKER